MRFALSTVSTLAVASVALGQEFPDPNPVPQADGTNLWYVGNNTQYPVIQDVLDAVSDGDEVVVGGLYVESPYRQQRNRCPVRLWRILGGVRRGMGRGSLTQRRL